MSARDLHTIAPRPLNEEFVKKIKKKKEPGLSARDFQTIAARALSEEIVKGAGRVST